MKQTMKKNREEMITMKIKAHDIFDIVFIVLGCIGSIILIDAGGEIARLSKEAGNYTGLGIGVLVMTLPIVAMFIGGWIWSASNKISASIEGDSDE